MKNNAARTIRSEEITIDVRICAALAANRGGEVYLAAIAPDMELTVITLEEAPGILPCFEEDDAYLNLPNTSSSSCWNSGSANSSGRMNADYTVTKDPMGSFSFANKRRNAYEKQRYLYHPLRGNHH